MLKDFTLSLELEPTENRVVQTAAIFWSHDVNTAKIYIELLRKGTPIILNKDVTVRVMMLFDDDNKSEHIYTAKIEDELRGLVSITLEESMRSYVGQVTAGVYIEYGNEEKTDNGYFTFGMRRSLIDKDMPELQKLYVSDFEKALEDIKEFKVDIDGNINNIERHFENVTDKLNNDLYTFDKELNDKAEKINNNLDKYTTLGEAFPFQSIYGGIRPIFHKHIKNMRDKLEVRKNNINVAIVADNHYAIRSNYWSPFPVSSFNLTHLLNVGSVSDLLSLSVALGDNCDEYTEHKHYMYQQQSTFSTVFQTISKCPAFLLKGNHDDNSGYSKSANGKGNSFALSDEDFAVLYKQNDNIYNENRPKGKNYFSYDVPGSLVTFIGVDTYDTLDIDVLDDDGRIKYPRMHTSAISQEQLLFISEELKRCKINGRHVLIGTHAPLKGVFSESGTKINHNLLLSLLKSFKNNEKGTLNGDTTDYEVELDYDFSEGDDGILIGCVYGHEHRDAYINKDGINHLIVVCNMSVNNEQTNPNHVEWFNTDYEDPFKVLSVNEKERTLESIKFGERGLEYNFNY